MPTEVRILPPPSSLAEPVGLAEPPGAPASAQIVLRPKRQATIPRRPREQAGPRPGDRLRARADGPGRLVLERIESPGGDKPA